MANAPGYYTSYHTMPPAQWDHHQEHKALYAKNNSDARGKAPRVDIWKEEDSIADESLVAAYYPGRIWFFLCWRGWPASCNDRPRQDDGLRPAR